MNTNDRDDLVQYDEMAKICDVDDTPFDDVMEVLVKFTASVLASNPQLTKLKIHNELIPVISNLLVQANRFLRKEISVEELEEWRVSAWDMFDRKDIDISEKHLFRIIALCLYDRDSAEYETFGSSAMFEIIFSTLNDLGKGYCALFFEFAQDLFKKI